MYTRRGRRYKGPDSPAAVYQVQLHIGVPQFSIWPRSAYKQASESFPQLRLFSLLMGMEGGLNYPKEKEI